MPPVSSWEIIVPLLRTPRKVQKYIDAGRIRFGHSTTSQMRMSSMPTRQLGYLTFLVSINDILSVVFDIIATIVGVAAVIATFLTRESRRHVSTPATIIKNRIKYDTDYLRNWRRCGKYPSRSPFRRPWPFHTTPGNTASDRPWTCCCWREGCRCRCEYEHMKSEIYKICKEEPD